MHRGGCCALRSHQRDYRSRFACVLSVCRCCSLSVELLMSSLATQSLLLGVFTPPRFLTFLPLYRGVFHVLPRSVLSKDEEESAAAAATLEHECGVVMCKPDPDAAAAPQISKRKQGRKRKQAERNERKATEEEFSAPPPLLPASKPAAAAPAPALPPPGAGSVAAAASSAPAPAPAPRRARRVRHDE